MALNRLGVLAASMGTYDTSKEYHMRHLDTVTGENRFIPQYNLGLACRLLGSYEAALYEFGSALNYVRERKVSFFFY